jgi:Transposase IS4
MMSIVRQNIQNAVEPASWLVVNELIIAYQGRWKHTIKNKNKPVKEGFKMWCLDFKGYIYTFRFYSGIDSGESMTKNGCQMPQVDPLPPVTLAPTF